MSEARKTILVADDEASVRKLIVSVLASRGFDTIEARNGLEAVQIYGTHGAIDLVITDVNMPVMDGLQALERMQAIDPGVRVIIVSACVGELAARGAAAGPWLSKPFRIQDLLDMVSKMLNAAAA